MGFGPRTDGQKFEGLTFDPIVKEYALVDRIKKTGEGPDDFIVIKEVKKTDEYNIHDVVQARAEGCTLKQLIKRIQAGEIMPEGRSPQYVDTTKSPSNLEEALELKAKTEAILDASKLGDLTKEQMAELSKLTKMNPTQVQAYVNNLVAHVNKQVAPKVVDIEHEPFKEEPVKKEGE